MVMKVRDVLLIILAIVCIVTFYTAYTHADTTCTEDTVEKNNFGNDIKNWGNHHLNELCNIVDCENERMETAEEVMEQYMGIYEYIITEMFPHVQTNMNPTK